MDANESDEDETDSIKVKMADMEDRARRNNIKIWGIPESVLQEDLRNYVSQLFTTVLPELSALDFTVDRIRLPKPTYLPGSVPRDAILRLYFYHTKEKLMSVSRQREQIPSPYNDLQFYADLSQYTLQKRRNLNTITALRNHKLSYKWGFPI